MADMLRLVVLTLACGHERSIYVTSAIPEVGTWAIPCKQCACPCAHDVIAAVLAPLPLVGNVSY